MKKIILTLLCLSFNISNIHATEFLAKNYIILNADTLQVLEGKDIHKTQSVASISKIMTAILTIENCDLNTEIVLNDSISKAYGSALYIHIGDTITLQDLLYGLMLRSGNDAALALADYTGGGIEHFIDMMNQKAQSLGMKNTVFSNPSGLDEEDSGNISSVYDMSLLMAYCISNPKFKEIISTKQYKRLDKNGTWTNKNKLLFNYEYCIGGKTGYTKKAKRTLINAAYKDEITLICVTFNCGDDFAFHQNLFETYFKQFEQIKLFNKGINTIDHYQFKLDENLTFPSFNKQPLSISYIIKDQKIILFYDKIIIGSYDYKYIKYPFFYRLIETFGRLLYE